MAMEFGVRRAALQRVADQRRQGQQRDDAGQDAEQGFPHGRTAGLRAGGRSGDGAHHVEGEHGRARPLQERRLVLAWIETERRAEARGAGDGDGQHASLGQDAPEIVEIDGDELDIGKTLREAENAAAKLGDLAIAFRARAFREDQDRLASFEQAFDRRQRIAARLGLAVDQHGADDGLGDEAVKFGFTPIVARGDGVGAAAHLPGQRRHHGDGVDMAAVIGEVDAAGGFRRAAQPFAARADAECAPA